MNDEYINVRWMNQGGPNPALVGVVQLKDKHTGNLKYRIGVGKGLEEKQDIQLIIDWGCKLDHTIGDVIFGVVEDSNASREMKKEMMNKAFDSQLSTLDENIKSAGQSGNERSEMMLIGIKQGVQTTIDLVNRHI